jgi:putative endonuclease
MGWAEGRRRLGQHGEALARQYFVSRGYEVLGENVRLGRVEIDLLVRQQRTVVFVEVKTRAGDAFGTPEEAVTVRKQQQVARGIAHWLRAHPDVGAVRFDVVAVTVSPTGASRLRHHQAVGEGVPLALLP